MADGDEVAGTGEGALVAALVTAAVAAAVGEGRGVLGREVAEGRAASVGALREAVGELAVEAHWVARGSQMPASGVASGWTEGVIGGGVGVTSAAAVSRSAVPVAMARAFTSAFDVEAAEVAAAEVRGGAAGVGLLDSAQAAPNAARARAITSKPRQSIAFPG